MHLLNVRRGIDLRTPVSSARSVAGSWNTRATIPTRFDCLLVRLFCPLTLAEADTRAAAVLVDEFDAGKFEARMNCPCVDRHGEGDFV